MANTQSTKRTATAARPEAPENRTPAEAAHEVKDGESLEDIADKLKVEPVALQRLNGIKRPELIWPGMVLRVPTRNPNTSKG